MGWLYDIYSIGKNVWKSDFTQKKIGEWKTKREQAKAKKREGRTSKRRIAPTLETPPSPAPQSTKSQLAEGKGLAAKRASRPKHVLIEQAGRKSDAKRGGWKRPQMNDNRPGRAR